MSLTSPKRPIGLVEQLTAEWKVTGPARPVTFHSAGSCSTSPMGRFGEVSDMRPP